MMSIYEKSSAVIDVTGAPYFADSTGKVDCTEALRRAFDDILRNNIDALEKTKQKLLENSDPNYAISFEIRKKNNVLNVIFPEALDKTKILYFPNGTYLVSDTITYSHENLKNILNGLPAMEMNRQIHFKGESRDGVVIKLKDNCKGFEYGANKPIVSFMQAERSNIAMTNTFEDITIDAGENNPGAVGLVFYANNSGSVKNVKIISTDKKKRGYAGLIVNHEIVSGCYVKNLEVDGFDYGVRAMPARNFSVFENIKVTDQKIAGFFIGNMIISVRNLYSKNTCNALVVDGPLTHLTLVDSLIEGGNRLDTAMDCRAGSCFVRNVRINANYYSALNFASEVACRGDYISEYVSDEVHTAFNTEKISEPVEVIDTPEIQISLDSDNWAYVDDFGAKADGVSDDTDAIQSAMNSGKKYVLFGAGQYRVLKPVVIPDEVERVNFMFCDFITGEYMQNNKENGLFVVKGDSNTLVLENVFTWEKLYGYLRFIEHAGKRTLIMQNLQTQTAAMYFNSVEGGVVFIENCACTVGGFGDSPYRQTVAFSFKGQTVYARHLNPERSLCEVLNDGGTLWVMGFKTENYGTAFKTVNGGQTEILGGTLSIGTSQMLPAIVNEDSTVSAVMTSNGYYKDQIFPITVKETQNGKTKYLYCKEFPIRFMNFYKIPLYVGRKPKK